MIKLKFDERRDIQHIIEDTKTILPSNIRQFIWYSALYFTKIVKSEQIFDDIVDYMTAHAPDFQYEGYLSVIDKCMRKAEGYQLKFVGDIVITQSDMDFIQSFGNLRKEKIAFVLVALARYFNALNQNDNNFVFAKTGDIFKMARVSVPAAERDYFFHFAYQSGLLKPNTSIGYNLLIVNLDNTCSDGVMTLDEFDYLELAYAYLNYKQGGYRRCKSCGHLFKLQKNAPAQKYCAECSKTSTTKQLICQECGSVFEVSNKNHKTYRCPTCQLKSDKVVKAQWYRENKQN